jgi:hypothetical protein
MKGKLLGLFALGCGLLAGRVRFGAEFVQKIPIGPVEPGVFGCGWMLRRICESSASSGEKLLIRRELEREPATRHGGLR